MSTVGDVVANYCGRNFYGQPNFDNVRYLSRDQQVNLTNDVIRMAQQDGWIMANEAVDLDILWQKLPSGIDSRLDAAAQTWMQNALSNARNLPKYTNSPVLAHVGTGTPPPGLGTPPPGLGGGSTPPPGLGGGSTPPPGLGGGGRTAPPGL